MADDFERKDISDVQELEDLERLECGQIVHHQIAVLVTCEQFASFLLLPDQNDWELVDEVEAVKLAVADLLAYNFPSPVVESGADDCVQVFQNFERLTEIDPKFAFRFGIAIEVKIIRLFAFFDKFAQVAFANRLTREVVALVREVRRAYSAAPTNKKLPLILNMETATDESSWILKLALGSVDYFAELAKSYRLFRTVWRTL